MLHECVLVSLNSKFFRRPFMIRELRLEGCRSIRKCKALDASLKHFGRTFVCIDCGDSSETLEQRCGIPRHCDFPRASWAAQRRRVHLQCRRPRRCEFGPWGGKVPWRRKWQPTPVLLPGKSHGQRSLVGYSP